MTASKTLERLGCSFTIGGFGRSDWRFDVGYDMSTMLEQTPDLITNLTSAGRGEVDFYSLGVERNVEFVRHEDLLEMTCRSRTDWNPDRQVETSSVEAFDAMLTRFLVTISRALIIARSPLADLKPFNSWPTLTAVLRTA